MALLMVWNKSIMRPSSERASIFSLNWKAMGKSMDKDVVYAWAEFSWRVKKL